MIKDNPNHPAQRMVGPERGAAPVAAPEAVADAAVNPAHYRQGSIQPWDYAFAQGWGPAFCQGNIVKYVTRYPFKNGVADLEKARRFLDKLIEEERKEEASPAPSSGASPGASPGASSGASSGGAS